MKIQYISDIHLEFRDVAPDISPQAEILVLAGDIGNPFSTIYAEFLEDVSRKFKKVFLVAGNHEFYGNPIDRTVNKIYVVIDTINDAGGNISFLNNETEIYGGVCFVGTTLWSRIKNAVYLINDFRYIPQMSVARYNELHTEARTFLETQLAVTTLPTVVITHHMPSYSLIAPEFRTAGYMPYNQCFASDCDELFKPPVKAWIYGHTHRPSVTKQADIQFLCAPLGYPGDDNKVDPSGALYTLPINDD